MSGYNIPTADAKKLVIEACGMLLEKGLVARTWGNVSARISDTEFVVTPSGRAYETLTADEIVTVKIDDCSYSGDVKPSSEKGIHADVYKLRSDVNFVIHTHQIFASAVSITGKSIVVTGQNDIDVMGSKIPCAKYGLSSTEKLRDNVREAFESHPGTGAVLMRSHGAVCVGADRDEAFMVASTLEDVAKVRFESICGTIPATGGKADQYEIYEQGTDGGDAERILPLLNDERKCVIISSSPFTLKMSRLGRSLAPYLDDQAQIVGTSIRSVPEDAPSVQIRDALKKNSAVFIKGRGALCFGSDESEAMAVCLVLEKGCTAAYLAANTEDARPVGGISAMVERTVYVKKYSKMK